LVAVAVQFNKVELLLLEDQEVVELAHHLVLRQLLIPVVEEEDLFQLQVLALVDQE